MSSSERCSVRPGSTNQRCAASTGWYRARSSTVVRPSAAEPWISPPRSLTQACRKSPPIVNAVFASVPTWKPRSKRTMFGPQDFSLQVEVQGRAVAGRRTGCSRRASKSDSANTPLTCSAICGCRPRRPACRPSVCCTNSSLTRSALQVTPARGTCSRRGPRPRRAPGAVLRLRQRITLEFGAWPVPRRARAEWRRQRGRTRRSRCRPCR